MIFGVSKLCRKSLNEMNCREDLSSPQGSVRVQRRGYAYRLRSLKMRVFSFANAAKYRVLISIVLKQKTF